MVSTHLFLYILAIVEGLILNIDLNCTVTIGNYTKWALNSDSCVNIYSPESCQAIYNDFVNQSTVTADGNNNRPTKCYSLDGGKTQNEDVKKIAIATCPKFCGYCCLTDNYNCKNAATSKVDCATLTQVNCATNRDSLYQVCPSTCGLCKYVPCVDSSTSCSNWGKNGFCTSTYYTTDQKKQYCAKTCALC